MQHLVCGLVTAGLLFVGASLTQADDTANALIDRAIKAHGGAPHLASLKVRQEKTRGTFEARGQTVTSMTDSLVQFPGQRRDTVEYEFGGKKTTSVIVINGATGWSSTNGQTREHTAERLKSLTDRLHADHVLTLKPLREDRGFTLSPLGEVKVGDRPALGVKVSARGRQDVDLYFDKASGLLVKSEVRTIDNRKQEVNLATVYSDYKETGGVQWPRKAVRYQDGKKIEETAITDLRFLSKIDDSEFAKP